MNEDSNLEIQILDQYQNDLITTLNEQKNDISKNLINNNWKKIQQNFELVFTEKSKEFKNKLINYIKSDSEKIQNALTKCIKLFYDYIYVNEDNQQTLEEYVSQEIGEEKNIDNTIDDMISDIIVGSRNATNWKNTSLWEFITSKFSDKAYLNKIIDYMISKSTNKISLFKNRIGSLIIKYKKETLEYIYLRKNRIYRQLEAKIKEEKSSIEKERMKNKKEMQKWEEEKKQYEIEKKKIEEMKEEYNKLKNEIKKIINYKEK